MSQRVTLKDVAKRIDYGLTTSATFAGDGPKFLRITDIDNSHINWKTVPTCNATPEETEKYSLETGDIVVARTGASTGRSQWVQVESATVFASYLVRFRISENFNSRFIGYVLNSRPWLHYVSSVAHGKSAQPNMSAASMADFSFECPSLAQQVDIAEVLGALDDKIAANTKLGHAVEAFGSAKFTRLGLDVEPTGEGILLDDLFHLNPRRTVSSDSPTIIDMKALPTASPLVEEWTTGSRKGGARFKNGDTLVARITPCLENRKTAFVDFLDDEEVGIGSTEFIIMRSKNDLPLGLSYFMAISDRFRDFAIQNLVGTSGRQRVAAADLARHTLSPVDVSELQEFGKWADENLKFLGSLREENRTLAEIRDALLPQLMSGKLRVKDAEKIVEDNL